MMLRTLIAAALALWALPAAAQTADLSAYSPEPYVQIANPEWTRAATIYELNTRQFTQEGTFRAAERQLPRLKALGIDIVWLMPIHPIGEKNRKGSLGSPYAVRDYKAVNPEFGTLDDLKSFVRTAHGLGMRVILDWVANHTAWDHPWATQHPDWYERDWTGTFRPTPWWDWSDIIDLDYSKPGVRAAMTDAMAYWVREVGIDGFRCDVAGYVPVDFWERVRAELNAIKPVFLLGEAQDRDLHRRAFDATYAWDWYNAMHSIAQGKANATALYGYYSGNESGWPMAAMRMTFVENHDKNAWEGTQYEAFGDALNAAIVLSVVGEGIPLLHNGQEAGNRRRLAFFEKDPITWRDDPLADLYRRLFAFKKANPALHNGRWGARMVKVDTDQEGKAFAFIRERDGNRIFALLNLSKEPITVRLPTAQAHGRYTRFTDGGAVTLGAESAITLPAWGYEVYRGAR